ncbi:lipid-A-disaccharide synthase N-terminal domain-containing protein [Lutimonas sp.]|uniref:lipid-A-disaccharide synthase N-terminal domain-containing protein n=1 Tax=Lutimonas sp. TaxID=1872403 RepID=UPI003D9BAD81
MNDWLIYSVGFLSQILFSSRILIQWVKSEKSKKVVTPLMFWQLSLLASFLLFIYGWLRNDFAIMLGQVITYFIYIRNLQLENYWTKLPKILRVTLFLVPVAIVIYGFNNNVVNIDLLLKNEDIPIWLVILGSIAQIVFTGRFVYQWIYSEKKKSSSLPLGFWVLSLSGSSLVIIYAILREDPVLLVGHVFGFFVYIRNIHLLNKSRK